MVFGAPNSSSRDPIAVFIEECIRRKPSYEELRRRFWAWDASGTYKKMIMAQGHVLAMKHELKKSNI